MVSSRNPPQAPRLPQRRPLFGRAVFFQISRRVPGNPSARRQVREPTCVSIYRTGPRFASPARSLHYNDPKLHATSRSAVRPQFRETAGQPAWGFLTPNAKGDALSRARVPVGMVRDRASARTRKLFDVSLQLTYPSQPMKLQHPGPIVNPNHHLW